VARARNALTTITRPNTKKLLDELHHSFLKESVLNETSFFSFGNCRLVL
jgi:hypothetical protein